MKKSVICMVLIASMILVLSQVCFAGLADRFETVSLNLDGETKHFLLDTSAGHLYELKSKTEEDGTKRYYLLLIPRYGSGDENFETIFKMIKKDIENEIK